MRFLPDNRPETCQADQEITSCGATPLILFEKPDGCAPAILKSGRTVTLIGLAAVSAGGVVIPLISTDQADCSASGVK